MAEDQGVVAGCAGLHQPQQRLGSPWFHSCGVLCVCGGVWGVTERNQVARGWIGWGNGAEVKEGGVLWVGGEDGPL